MFTFEKGQIIMRTAKEFMPMVYSLKCKVENGEICNDILYQCSTWREFKKNIKDKEIVLYGMGEIFDYFCDLYKADYEVAYAVDKKIRGKGIQKRGVLVASIEKLQRECKEKDIVILITAAKPIDDIYETAKSFGCNEIYSLAAMEYRRPCIRRMVKKAIKDDTYTKSYELECEVKELKKQVDLLKKQSKERFMYSRHVNWVLNAVINKLGYEEMREEQISYSFQTLAKNTYAPDLKDPKTFNEKILHLKINGDKQLYKEVSEKYTFKKYLESRIDSKYIVPLIGIWDDADEVDFDSLPEQFVLKATRGGNSDKVIICEDKSKLNVEEVKENMKKWKVNNEYCFCYNATFKDVKQRYLVEKLLDIKDLPYYDYKVHCFKGEPRYVHVVSKKPHELAFYDMEWNKQDFTIMYPRFRGDVPKPWCLDKMIELSRILSEPFDYVRVDFYVLPNELYVGELTLTSFGGMGKFYPQSVDVEWGKMIEGEEKYEKR